MIANHSNSSVSVYLPFHFFQGRNALINWTLTRIFYMNISLLIVQNMKTNPPAPLLYSKKNNKTNTFLCDHIQVSSNWSQVFFSVNGCYHIFKCCKVMKRYMGEYIFVNSDIWGSWLFSEIQLVFTKISWADLKSS